MGRNTLEQDQQRAAAWFAARLTAYAPEKPRSFPALEHFLTYRKTKRKPAKVDWKDQFAKASAWIQLGKI